MQGDPYRHAHGHNQQPGNEWNDSRHLRAPNPGSVGGFNVGPPPVAGGSSGGGGGGGGGTGIGMLVLLVVGAAVLIPAAAMALLATPVLKAVGPRLGRYVSFGWLQTLWTTLVGGMWYLGLTVVLFLAAETYLTYGLNGIPTTMDGLAAWQQWLAAAGWSAAKVIEWVGRLWSLGPDYAQYGELYPATVPIAMLVGATAALHLPGLMAYSLVLQRAGYLGDGWRSAVIGVGVAMMLVLVTLPVATWAGSVAFAALQAK